MLAVPVVDVFAGPGGLGEGFASYRASGSKHPFTLAVSIEKDPHAHQTLRFRSLRRLLHEDMSEICWRYMRGEADWAELLKAHPREASIAQAEAVRLELSPSNVGRVRDVIRARISEESPWVLIGGPPCQAYSLVGRARNRGNKRYVPEADKRQTLYIEYLQILADHAPPVFVMENVKGLLSARLENRGIFARIQEDLCNPAVALKREERRCGSVKPRYVLQALAAPSELPADDPRRFIVRSERHGVPQRRHRVIIVGVREDLRLAQPLSLRKESTVRSVRQAIGDLPALRSGLSKATDSGATWLAALKEMKSRRWFGQMPSEAQRAGRDILSALHVPKCDRGGEVLAFHRNAHVLNHASRSHILADLERYLFAALVARQLGHSPTLADYPRALLPAHANVSQAILGGVFADRFRVQLAQEPATTITSHIAKDGHYYIHYDAAQCRSLSVREAARLQTFPDDYFFCGPRTSQYLQVGNAVPPVLAGEIARAVYRALGG